MRWELVVLLMSPATWLIVIGALCSLFAGPSYGDDTPVVQEFHLNCVRENHTIDVPSVEGYVFRPFLCREGGVILYMPERILVPRAPLDDPLDWLRKEDDVEI